MGNNRKWLCGLLCLAMLYCTLAMPICAAALPANEDTTDRVTRFEHQESTSIQWTSANPVLPGNGHGGEVTWPFENACVRFLKPYQRLTEYLRSPIYPTEGGWVASVGRDMAHSWTENSLQFLSVPVIGSEEPVLLHWAASENMKESSSIAFGLRADPLSMDGHDNTEDGRLTVHITVIADGQEQTGQVYLSTGEWVVIDSALPTSARRYPVEEINLRLESTRPMSVQLTTPHRSDKECAFVEEFSASSIRAGLGAVETSAHWLYLEPDAGGAVNLIAETELFQYVPHATGWYLAVTVEGTAAGGMISVGTHSGYEESAWQESVAQQVTAGSHTYLFRLPGRNQESLAEPEQLTAGMYVSPVAGPPERFQVSFQNVTGETGPSFRISHMELWPVEEPIWQEGNLGSLGIGQMVGSEMVWRGKLTRQAATTYRDAEIALLAVPVWNRYDLRAARELDRVQVSNSYTFTLPVQGREQYGAGWLFYAAIRQTRKTQDPDVKEIVTYLPISQPKMLGGHAIEPCALSLFGFHDASAVGVYESNVSHVTVDVIWDRLLTGQEQGITAGFGGSAVSLNSSYLAGLDQDIQFYCDAGLEVGLRIATEKGGTLPHADTPEEAGQYMAAIWYLCKRYPAVASITLGHGINCEEYSSGSLEHPERVYPHVATLAALTYQTARLVNPDIFIVIPFADSQGYAGETAAGGISIEPETAMLLFASALQDFGSIPWAASWRLEDDRLAEEAAALPTRWKQVLQTLALPAFSDFLYRWEPDTCLTGEAVPYELTERYDALCQTLSGVKPRAVILSLTHIADSVSQTMYGRITGLEDPAGTGKAVREVQKLTGSLVEDGRAPSTGTAMTTVWDFAMSYDRQGFVAGGGIDRLYTYRNPDPDPDTGRYQRVLRSTLPMNLFENMRIGRSGGVLLRNFAGNVDLSKVDYLTFTYTLTEKGVSKTPPTVIFLVGSEDFRAEYKVEGTLSGQTVTAVCDLRDYDHAPTTGYIGVMLYGETELVFDLASVKAWSGRLTVGELDAVFNGPAPEPTAAYEGEVLTMIILVAISSVCIAVLLVRKDREEEQKEREKSQSYRYR